jgi:hypothetical protein
MVKDEGKQAAGAEPRDTVSCRLDDIRQSSLLEQHPGVDGDVLSLGTYSNETSPQTKHRRIEPTPRLASQDQAGKDARSRFQAGPEPDRVMAHDGLQAMLRAVAKVHIKSQGLFLIPTGGEPGDDFLVRRFHEQQLARNDIIVSSQLCSVL